MVLSIEPFSRKPPPPPGSIDPSWKPNFPRGPQAQFRRLGREVAIQGSVKQIVCVCVRARARTHARTCVCQGINSRRAQTARFRILPQQTIGSKFMPSRGAAQGYDRTHMHTLPRTHHGSCPMCPACVYVCVFARARMTACGCGVNNAGTPHRLAGLPHTSGVRPQRAGQHRPGRAPDALSYPHLPKLEVCLGG